MTGNSKEPRASVMPGSQGNFKRNRRLMLLILMATALLLFTNAGHTFMPLQPMTSPAARESMSILAGATHMNANSVSHQEGHKVRMAAGVPELFDLSMGFNSFGVQFLIAILPAILIEIIVLNPVQESLESAGIKNVNREYVTSSSGSIPVQIPYTIDNWQGARENPSRFVNVLTSLFSTSTLLKRLQGPLLVLNLVAAAVLFYDGYLVPGGFVKLSLPIVPFTISSFALGLLLVYKVNNATQRYVRARDLWGDMLNISRDLTQQASQWANREDFVDYARWVPAFTRMLMCALRSPKKHDIAQELRNAAGPNGDLKGEGEGLSEQEVQNCLDRPAGMLAHHYVTHMLRCKTKLMDLPLEQRLMMEQNVTRLINDCGACENVFSTPIPVALTKHTTRFLFLWLLFLPFALTSQLGVGVVLVQQLLSFGLLGIEDIAIQIEQPFDVLPLERICFKISNEGQIVRANFDLLEAQAAGRKLEVAA